MIGKELKNDVYKEALTFIAYFDKCLLDKMPLDIFEKLTKLAAESSAEFFVDKTKTLAEQKISEECKDLIAFIYYSSITDENEKKELMDKWNINDRKK